MRFLPKAGLPARITLPFTLSFRAGLTVAPPPIRARLVHSIAVFLFSTRYALEVLADLQLDQHKRLAVNMILNREGIWSIVRHLK